MRRIGLGLGMIAAAFALGGFAPSSAALRVGQPAPDFELRLIDGTRIKRADLIGQVVVINYWATWCAPCKIELPVLDRFYRAAGRHGLKVFAVTTEDSVPVGALRKVFAAMAIPPVERVKGRGYNDFEAVPMNYVIDRAGVLRHAKAGAFDLEELNELIVPLLEEPAPPPAPPAP